MEFPDSNFDVVYSYHALEHIPNYRMALTEMRRVLKRSGTWCIGTPNRARLLGYLGGRSSFRQKVLWNLADWKARALGRFRNEYGAHAGYTAYELSTILCEFFDRVEQVTYEYYRRLYPEHPRAIEILEKTRIGTLLLPSIYFVGKH